MRERPPFVHLQKSALRAQWLCVVADHFLGQPDLRHFMVMSSGFDSVVDHPGVSAARLALQNLRLLGFDAPTTRSVFTAVSQCLDWEADEGAAAGYTPPYKIEPDAPHRWTRRFDPSDPVYAEMITFLGAPLPYRTRDVKFADPLGKIRVITDKDQARSVQIDLSQASANIPALPVHDLARKPRGEISVAFSDLLALARELDEQDRRNNVLNPGNWEVRLVNPDGSRKFDILVPRGTSLAETSDITLSGLQHMIGLPGAGKTTLVQLMLIWLDRNGYRVVVLLPSIEASLGMIGVLKQYGTEAGLLVGQSPSTRRNHAARLAERIASQSEAKGFGTTGAGADMLAMNCVLDGFREPVPEDIQPFPHMDPPCEDLHVSKKKKNGEDGAEKSGRLCPVASWCGRMAAPRSLTHRNIWIGHILSTSPRVTTHFLADHEQIRFFDLIARTMDLVIVDEADGAQSVLDGNAIVELDLTGSPESMESKIHRDLIQPFSSGAKQRTSSNVYNYHNNAFRFQEFNLSFVSLLHEDHQARNSGKMSRLIEPYLGRFVTGLTVIGNLVHPADLHARPEDEQMRIMDRSDLIRRWWDSLIQNANQMNVAPDDPFGFELPRIAAAFGKTEAEISTASTELRVLLAQWISSIHIRQKKDLSRRIKDHLLQVLEVAGHVASDPETVAAHLDMLIAVSCVIAQYNVLTAAQQAMIAEGVHEMPFGGSVSEDLARVLPEAIVGRLAGVRVSLEKSDETGREETLRVQYLNFRSAPRMLLYKWHTLHRAEGLTDGPNVLLTSATSFLEGSPSYHIDVGPDYVLRRTGQQTDWKNSRWRFMPIPDPSRNGELIFFSGAKGPLSDRPLILQRMIDHYFSGDDPLVVRLTKDFDEGRKVAFVVNSYDQVNWIKEHIAARYPSLSKRVIGVTRSVPKDSAGDWIVTGQVEMIGRRDDWDAIVFPMRALSRGVNIVFQDGPQKDNAALGTIVFLTRPHPSADNTALISGIAGHGTMKFDRDRTVSARPDIDSVERRFKEARRETLDTMRRLLQTPIVMNRLGPHVEAFVADTMIEILQTIGRAMRNGVRARVIFADAAWAPRSASGNEDTATSSMLVAIMKILDARLNDPDPVKAEIYRAMYEPFMLPLRDCDNLLVRSQAGGKP